MEMEMKLRNFTEDAVAAFLDKWFHEADCCHCELCRMDVAAIMLNNLKPKYVVTDKGAMYAQLEDFDPQTRIDYMAEMSQAAILVKEKSRH